MFSFIKTINFSHTNNGGKSISANILRKTKVIWSHFNVITLVSFSLFFVACGNIESGVPIVETNLTPGQGFIPQPSKGQRYRVDLLTIEPGSEIYSAWGHTALRLFDSKKNIDVVFDYGLFDFSSTFLLRFVMGRPAFKVGAYHMAPTLRRYRKDNRRIFAQQIILNDSQAKNLWDKMMLNILPQNSTFQYHHFLDNCTTRVRDKVDQALVGQVIQFFKGKEANTSHRKNAMKLILGRPWLWFASNWIAGPNIDQKLDQWQAQFLPLDLLNGLENFRKAGHHNQIGKIQTILEPINKGFRIELSSWISTSLILILILAVFFIFPIVLPNNKTFVILGRFGFVAWNFIAGFGGLIICLIWALTDHDSVFNNINVLGTSPILLFVLFYSIYLNKHKKIKSLLTIHRFLIAPPLIGFLMSLLGLVSQFSWPFLLFAFLIQFLVYLRFLVRAKNKIASV